MSIATGFTLSASTAQREHSHIVRVMTLNAQAGVNARGAYDLDRQAQAIANAAPTIVGVQEMTRNHASYRCEDQPRLLAARLQAITGRPWTSVYVNEWVTTHRQCVDGGEGDGVETEGLAFLAPEPIESVEHVRLWNSRIGLSARLRSVPGVSFVVTHLAANVAGQRDRVRQIAALLPWTEARRGTVVLLGDFNAAPDAPELQPILARYRDAWRAAAARGDASGSGETHKGWRIDDVFYAPMGRLTLEHAAAIDTSALYGLAGPEVSDHRPVVASFRLDSD